MRRFPTSKAIATLLAAVLLGLGIPQAVDSLLWLYAEAGIDAVNVNTPQGAADVASAAALLEAADDWFGDPHAKIRAGILQWELAFSQRGSTPFNPQRLERAIDDLTGGLARAPTDAAAWATLGRSLVLKDDFDGARRTLHMSMVLAPYEPAMALMRSDLGLQLWSFLDGSDRQMLGYQFGIAWDQHPGDFATLAHRSGNSLAVITAFAQDPKRLLGFLEALRQYH